MDIRFAKLCKEIDFTPSNKWDHVFLVNVNLEKQNTFNLKFEISNVIPLNEMKLFLQKLNDNFKYNSKIHFNPTYKNYDKKLLVDYIEWALKTFINSPQLFKELNDGNSTINSNGQITFTNISQIAINEFVETREKLLLILERFGFLNINIILEKRHLNLKEFQTQEIEIQNYLEEKLSKKITDSSFYKNNQYAQSFSYKEFQIHELRNLESYEKNIITQGIVFKVSEIKTKKNGLYIFSIGITNGKDAIICKKFLSQYDNKINIYKSIKENTKLWVKGQLEIDKYSSELVIKIRGIKTLTENTKKFINEDERVELAARSKMSVMDGLESPKSLYNYAKKNGITSLAITDLDNVQAFPDYYASTQNDDNFKAIYGMTVRLKLDTLDIISKKKNGILQPETYVVFDLETTGLFQKYNGIIEFGAIKIVNGKIIDKLQFFINPGQPIPPKIEELTKITNDDIKDAISEKEGMLKILNFFDNSILIAHNAIFDMSFIYGKIEKYSLIPIDNIVIDTLPLSRVMDNKYKRHSLEYFALRYNVQYDVSIAHGADYDANVLGMIWMKIMDKLSIIQMNTFSYLWTLNNSDVGRNRYLQQIRIIAKNNQGLKRLFQLCSIANTKNFNQYPVLYKSDLESDRENILISSAGIDGHLWNLELNSIQTKLEEEFMFYDYIETNPPSNFSHLIQREDLTLDNIQQSLQNIINTSIKLNKIIVVTAEPRYNNLDDSNIHKIYIESKGLGGKAHNLFKYNEANPDYPKQFFKNATELKNEFSFLNDTNLIHDIVVTNTHKISDLIKKNRSNKTKIIHT